MPNSIDDLTHSGQTIPDLFELVVRCERRVRNNQALDDWAEYFIANGPVKLPMNPPKDEEEDDDGAFFDDPVYEYFTHRNLGIPE